MSGEARRWLRATDLDRASIGELRELMLSHEPAEPVEPRTYPGYPRWPLPRPGPRLPRSLDKALRVRRSVRAMSRELPGERTLGRLLGDSHGITAEAGRGPVPSAGGLQALELYIAVLEDGWLPRGVYHYDRAGHGLSQLRSLALRANWMELVPSINGAGDGALVLVVVGDAARVTAKYGERGLRFLLLEAGHLMQNLCLLSGVLGLALVPLGGFCESAIARELQLPATDEVLYAAVCGIAAAAR